jgi:hypothetical protein
MYFSGAARRFFCRAALFSCRNACLKPGDFHRFFRQKSLFRMTGAAPAGFRCFLRFIADTVKPDPPDFTRMTEKEPEFSENFSEKMISTH